MGFSPGDFVSKDNKFHLEGGGNGIITLWNDDESKALLDLDLENARRLLANLELLISMVEEDAL